MVKIANALNKKITLKKSVMVWVLIVTLSSAAGFLIPKKGDEVAQNNQNQTNEVAAEPEKPATAPNPLTGVDIEPSAAGANLFTVMIENSTDSRPQAGLSKAGHIYEAIAEGGITRFLAVFQEIPAKIGPIRSARPYFIDYAAAYNTGYGHAGGSPQAKQDISSLGVKDMDDSTSYFYRNTAKIAPHNLYGDGAKITKTMNDRGYKLSSNITKFEYFSDQINSVTTAATANTINLKFPSALYSVLYNYNTTSKSYDRYVGGTDHKDETTGSTLSPSNVLALVVPLSLDANGLHSVYKDVGTGTGKLMNYGKSVDITWKKTTRTAPLVINYADGTPAKFAKGQTWITLVNSGDLITIQ